MALTYEPIATTTLGSATNTITFSSIPSSYTDLRLITTFTTTAATTQLELTFNGDTTVAYSFTYMTGNGTSVVTSVQANTNYIYATEFQAVASSTTIPTMSMIDIFNYKSSTNKSVLIHTPNNQNTSGADMVIVGLWQNGGAINSLTLKTTSSTVTAGSIFTLYGIAAA